MQSKKLLLPLLSCLLLFTQVSKAQLHVVLKDNTAFIAVKVDTGKAHKGKINIDKIPDSIVLFFPDEDPQNFSMQFNEDSLKFFVGFGCSGDSCVKLLLSDVKENKVVLTFLSNRLISVGGRRINPREILLKKENKAIPPFVLITPSTKSAKKEEKDMYSQIDPGKYPQNSMEGSTPEFRQEMQKIDTNKFFCGTIVCQDCDKPCDTSKKKPCIRNFFKCENEYDLFNRVFEKTHQFHNAQTSEKVTPKYWVVYDNRDGRNIIPYYFKIHNGRSGKDFLQIKTGISPMARKHAVFTILGPKDSVYIIDETALQYYEESEPKVSEVFQGIKPAGADPIATPPDAKQPDQEDNVSITEQLKSIELSKFYQYDNSKTIAQKFGFARENFSSMMSIQFNKSIEERAKSSKEDSANIVGLLDKYVEAIRDIQILQNENRLLADRIKELEKDKKKNEKRIADLTNKIKQKEGELIFMKKELIAANKEINRLRESLKNKSANQEFYVNLKALERDLEKLNAQYEDISFVERQFQADKLCLQLKIKSILGVTTVQSSSGLAAALIERVIQGKVDTMHFSAFSRVIKDIEYQYGVLLGKKIKYSIFSSSKKTPNTDEFITAVKTKNVVTPFYTDTFKTSWGLKIDFSTGVFINGLSSPEFGLSQHTFRYKETRDTILPSGADSTMYTGVINTATGNLVHANYPKISYSAGFLVHVYPRTGTFYNAGMVTGVTINNSNSSPLQIMLGGCIMFNASKSARVSVVGGITWGQVKELSSTVEPYKWDKTTDPDNRLYNSIHEVPRFYNGSSDLLTYNKWKHSWFFGITYNFASLNAGK